MEIKRRDFLKVATAGSLMLTVYAEEQHGDGCAGVRHRLASYSQQSQRYVKEEQFDCVIPPSIKQDPDARRDFIAFMDEAQARYTAVLKRLAAAGIAGEAGNQDARYLLPNAAETKIVVTMNARELLHFFRVRCSNRAQWEIREMAVRMSAWSRA